VGTTLKGDDFKLGSSPTRLRRRAHASRIAANDNESFCRHDVFVSFALGMLCFTSIFSTTEGRCRP
jgi:hypothetical protein